MTYQAEDFLYPSKECDLVMKGGITSGVVYPPTVLELARDYSFRNIGGTSAGAIAAGLAAAAEYDRRAHGSGEGFVRLAAVVGYLQQNLLNLFQPDRRHRKIFKALLKIVRRGENPIQGIVSAIRHVPTAIRLVKTLQKLPDTYFGLCPGRTQRGYKVPGLTDWLNELIETLAGRIEDGRLPETPLTFEDLEAHGIKLRTVTTSLGTQTPVLLPFTQRTWMAAAKDLEALFPENVSAHLMTRPDTGSDLFDLPPSGETTLPVLFGIRASLSFPVLLAALPLYQRDRSIRFGSEEEKERPRVCWLSDGGITSNFPIHLFDSPLPSRPTFGLSLEGYSKERQESEKLEDRVYLPVRAGQGRQREIHEISSLGGFIGGIFNSARNWQDSSQTLMPGYRERVARIFLTGQEGGLNLEMDGDVVKTLGDLGKIAGHKLRDLDLGEHQWRRLLATYSALEIAFGELVPKFDDFKAKVNAHSPRSYKPSDDAELEELWDRLTALVDAAKPLAANPIRDSWGPDNNMPSPSTFVKLVSREQAGRN